MPHWTPTTVLRGERVRLDALQQSDLPVLADWQEDDAQFRLYDAIPAVPKTVAQLESWLGSAHQSTTGYVFAIRQRTDDALLGVLELDGILWPHRTTYISIMIGAESNRGRGLGSEALRIGLRFAFQELNLYRVALTVFAYNTRAITTYERLGFTHEGTHREFLERDGQRHDMLLYGMLRPEWQQRFGSGESNL